jgi:Protein of unknown function (DUF3800)
LNQAFIDDSGSEPESPLFVLAGFIASYERWIDFSDEWQGALDEPPKLEYFKMKEAARLRGQFDKSRGWNESERDRRIASLTGIITKYAQIRIHASIRNDHFDKYLRSLPTPGRNLATDSPYTMLCLQIMMVAGVFAPFPPHSLQGPCDFIFDEQLGHSEEIMGWWPTIKRNMDASSKTDLPKFFGSLPIWRDEKCFLPLQAADLYAWQLRRYDADNQILRMPMRKPHKSLVEIPVITRNYDEPELKRLRDFLWGCPVFC